MMLGVWFWILMLIWLVLGAWGVWTTPPPGRWTAGGGGLVLFLLVLILGLHAFGSPIKG